MGAALGSMRVSYSPVIQLCPPPCLLWSGPFPLQQNLCKPDG